MKTLLILRHGKAEDNSPGGDKGRRLTKKGERDAAFIGGCLQARFGVPDFVIASDSMRARHTAEIASVAAGYGGEVALASDIYDADVADLVAVVQTLPDSANRVLLVGHNPGLAMLVLALDREADTPPPLAPATLIALSLDIAHWTDVGPRCGRRLALLTPEHHKEKEH